MPPHPHAAAPATPLPSPAPEPLRRGPRHLRELFWAFTVLALQGFGGVLAVVQRELVDKKKWLTPEEFVEEWAVAQILPGPNVINLSVMLGERYFGWRGALTGIAGMLLAPSAVVLALAWLYASVADVPMAQGALRGMGGVAAGLVAGSALKLVPTLRKNCMGGLFCAAWVFFTFASVALLHWPLGYVLLGLGSLATCWAYAQLSRLERRARSTGEHP